MKRRLRLAAAAVLVAAGVLAPVASGADADGTANDASPATAQCPQGYSYDSGSGDCEKDETQPATASCPATIGGHAVQSSGDDCVTTAVHTTLPAYSCNTAEGWALAGDPPECQRTVTREVTERRTVTDMVTYTQTYTVRVPSTVTERQSYTVQVRVPPLTKRVRVAPFTKTYMGMETYTYTARVRYCVQYDVEFGSGCVKYGYRNEQRTGVRETLITEPVYRYESQPVYNYRDEVRYRNVTRTVYRDETRTRQVCCRPVTRVVTVTRTVRDTQSAVPEASCAAAGYSLNSSSRCARPVGTRLGAAGHRCAAGWAAVSGDPANCERTLTRDPAWVCAAGRTIDRATTPPHCHLAPDPDEDEDEDEDEEEDEDPDEGDEDEEDPDDDDDPAECATALATLGTGTVTRSGTWAAGCVSSHKSTDQVPYYAWRYTFTVTSAATLDVDAVSAQDPHVYVTDSGGTVVGSDDDSGLDGRDSRIRGLSLKPGAYTIEVTTGSERTTGSFTLTLKLTAVAAGKVSVSGFADAEGTPDAGKSAVTVSSGFTVSPVGSTCTATPTAATVAPASGASRTVSLSVAAATTATVTVTCVSGSASDTASAKFKANPAPGVHNCGGPLGTLSSVKSSRTGTLDSTAGCRSVRHPRYRDGRVFYASRHTFRMAAAGWATIDLENTGSGADRIDAYVLLLNGSTPDGTGTRLAHDDDSGAGLNSRIVRRFLQPGRYTIEATTFGPRDQGTYRIIVSADYRPKITGTAAQAVMRVENGGTVTRRWTYTPASTRVAVAAVTPTDGIDTKVTADQGNAALTATPSEVGTFDIYVAHSNGGTTSSLHTKIISYCPEGQIELPADCAKPKPMLLKQESVILVFPKSGFAPEGFEQSNWCLETQVTEKTSRYLCRRKLAEERAFVSKTDSRVLSVSEPQLVDGKDFGRMLLLRSEDGYVVGREGCQTVTADFWQCAYRSDRVWVTELDDADIGNLVGAAIKKFALAQLSATVATAKCAAAILALYASANAGGTFSPQAGAAVFIICPAALPSST